MFDVEYEMSVIRDDGSIDYEQLEYILRVGEELRSSEEIAAKVKESNVNYRIK